MTWLGLIDRLRQAELDLDDEDLADVMWLAQQIGARSTAAADQPSEPEAIEDTKPDLESLIVPPSPDDRPSGTSATLAPPTAEPAAVAALPTPRAADGPDARSPGLPFRSPSAPALRQVRQLERALRPLMRKAVSATEQVLDEEATIDQAADRDLWLPILRPGLERWLEVALVIEESPGVALWESLIGEWQALLARLGAFRDVRVWSLRGTATGEIAIAPRTGGGRLARPRSPRELLDPTGRRSILVLSDCTSALWQAQPLRDCLALWSQQGPTTIVQVLPERLWQRTALGLGYPVRLRSELPGLPSAKLTVEGLPEWKDWGEATSEVVGEALCLPVVTIEPGPLERWARLVAGSSRGRSAGVFFEPGQGWSPLPTRSAANTDPEAIVQQFWATASPLAQRLAGYLAAVPVSLPVLNLIQAALLPESNQVEAAEVLMGGLLERVGTEEADGAAVYDFRAGVRSWLVGSMPRSHTEAVLEAVSEQIAARWGLPGGRFAALLLDEGELAVGAAAAVREFARVAQGTLRQMGGEFAALADRLEERDRAATAVGVGSPNPPPADPADGDMGQLVELGDSETRGQTVIFEDQRMDGGSNSDYNDVIIRLQGLQGYVPSINPPPADPADGDMGQLVELGDSETRGQTVIFEDQRMDGGSNSDYNDVIVRLQGLQGYVPSINGWIDGEEGVGGGWAGRPRPSEEEIGVGGLPPLEEFAFEEGYLELEEVAEAVEETSGGKTLELQWFVFETARIVPPNATDTATESQSQFQIERFSLEKQQFIEPLPGGLELRMVRVEGGTFLMGSPEEEAERLDSEGPQHRVSVPEFFMGRYPVTQAQWKAIASLPKVEIDLDPEPSNFKDDAEGDLAGDRPVERVSWHEATEACARLSQFSGLAYRLPSEAEWEYACRAGTTTPFCFGETLSPELANYDGKFVYANGPKGVYRERTTKVGSFPANRFGLYDMHGNVWEWCLDLWHENYDGAPEDENAWTQYPASDSRLVRGGSWIYVPRLCRSAYRYHYEPGDRYDNLGFRFCCSVARTP